MRILLYRSNFWDPASEDVDKGKLTYLPTVFWHYTEKQETRKKIKTIATVQKKKGKCNKSEAPFKHSALVLFLKWDFWDDGFNMSNHAWR